MNTFCECLTGGAVTGGSRGFSTASGTKKKTDGGLVKRAGGEQTVDPLFHPLHGENRGFDRLDSLRVEADKSDTKLQYCTQFVSPVSTVMVTVV